MQFNKIISDKRSFKIIDLGMHPYADSFINKNNINNSEPVYPLKCYLNKKSGFIFNKIITSSIERYNLFDYSYTSSNSNYSRNYWKKFFINIKKKNILKKNDKILEIGSNDGYLCKQFQNEKCKVYGADASKFMCKIANKNGIKTFNLIFNKKNSQKIKNKIKKVNIVIANNVLNHSNEPFDFISGVQNILEKNGYFIFEVPYWLFLVKKKQFDQIYHEHINYFTIKSIVSLLKKSSLSITNVETTPYHGGSLRVFCIKNKGNNNNLIIKKYLKNEYKNKLFNFDTYKKMQELIKKKKLKFLKKIINLKLKNKKIIGIGAAAKANTLINYLKLDSEMINFITDISPYKINKLTPLSRIPIYNDNYLKKIKDRVYVVILSWNISKLLIIKLKKINKKLVFIKF
jgi:SAM-dependent methyltransferase